MIVLTPPPEGVSDSIFFYASLMMLIILTGCTTSLVLSSTVEGDIIMLKCVLCNNESMLVVLVGPTEGITSPSWRVVGFGSCLMMTSWRWVPGHTPYPSPLSTVTIMQEIEPHTIENFFGLTDSQRNSPNESGYILFYQSREEQAAVVSQSWHGKYPVNSCHHNLLYSVLL